MLLKYLNSNRISIAFLLSLLPVVYWIPSFFLTPVVIPEPSGLPLTRLINSFSRDFRLLSSLLALALIITNGYLLNQLNTIHIFIPFRTRLPAFFYIILTVSMTQLHFLTPQLIASSLVILAFYRIFSAYKVDRISLSFLDAGILIALASMVYFQAIVLVLFLFSCLIILRPFIWREWVFTFLGLAIPYIFLISIYYITGNPLSGFLGDIADSMQRSDDHFMLSQMINMGYVMFILLIGSYFIARALDQMKIHARKFFLVFLFIFLISLLMYLLPGAGAGLVYVISIPLAYLFTYYFVRCRPTWVNEIFILLFLLLLIWQRF